MTSRVYCWRVGYPQKVKDSECAECGQDASQHREVPEDICGAWAECGLTVEEHSARFRAAGPFNMKNLTTANHGHYCELLRDHKDLPHLCPKASTECKESA